MCTIVKKNQKVETLNEDLKVYKVMSKEIKKDIFFSSFRMFPFKKGELYKTEIAEEVFTSNKIPFDNVEHKILNEYDKPIRYIGSGFHSALNIERLKLSLESFDIIVECTIPKGSQILRGIDEDLVVSNQIIINEIVFNNSEN